MTSTESELHGADAGYSIVEMLIVLVVLAASVVIVALPRVSASRDAMTLDAAAYRLAAALVEARAGSISGSAPRELVLDPDRHGYRCDRDKVLKRLGSGVALSTSGFASEPGSGRKRVRFNPDGTATGGTIILRKSRVSVSVAVDWMTGAVRVRRRG